ncbi:MAG TPA: AAA family ATPase [Gemmatimonadaceae bacterium]|nr:AAA family ATPase [Gemmatimonadaceae bacterium]
MPLPAVWPLVGRQTELRLIQHTLDSAAAGRCSALILSGESGVGKTRLAELAVQHATEHGWTVASGSAFPVESGVPYALFGDALGPVFRQLGDPAITLLSRGAKSQLAYIFPALAPDAPRDESVAYAPEFKGRLLWTMTQLLSGIAARAPLLLVLENLQWADPSSLEMLHFLVRQLRDARVAVIGTYNDTEFEALRELQSAARSLVELGAAVQHTVSPLGRADIDELLRRVFGKGAVPRHVRALLYERTRGNPFFLEQTLKALVASGRLEQQEGSWIGWDLEGLELPRSIRNALMMRVDSLSPATRTVADFAAVIGTRLAVDVLHAASGLEMPMLIGALEQLCRRNVLTGQSAGERVTYDFTHPMIRETLYLELGVGRAALMHAQVAGAIERLRGTRSTEHADELAFHYVRASIGDLTPKAMRYLMLAGRAALEKHADREAARYLDAAARQFRRHEHESGSDGARSEDFIQLLTDLAIASHRLGKLGEALALWTEARVAAIALGDYRRVASIERRMALACYWQGRHAEGLQHAEAGLRAIADDESATAQRAKLHIARGACLMEIGRPDEARRALADALADADATGDDVLRARAHRELILADIVTCRPAEAREHAATALELAERAGRLDVAGKAHWALAVLAALTGSVSEVQHSLAHAERIADELGSPELRLLISEVAVELLAGLGEWDTALARAEQSISLARALRQHTLLPRLLVWTAVIYVGRGAFDRAKRYLDEAARITGADQADPMPRDVNSGLRVYMGLAVYHNARNEYTDAIRVSRIGLAVAEKSGHAIWAIYRLWPALIEAHLWIHEFDEADHLLRELRQASELMSHRLGLAWTESGEALAAMLRGTTPALLQRVVDSLAGLEQVPYIFDAARLRREIARRYVELGDSAAAVRVLNEACVTFERLGAVGELAGAREQLKALGAASRTRARPPATRREGVLSERKTAIARLVAEHRTNKEIAKALDNSARTVSTQLSQIYHELGIRNRSELAEWVRAGGLLENAQPAARRKRRRTAATRPVETRRRPSR